MNFALDMAALNGTPVTEAHAKVCRERGHATHTVDGVDQGFCPRCGDLTTRKPAPSEPVRKAAIAYFCDTVSHMRGRLIGVELSDSDCERITQEADCWTERAFGFSIRSLFV